jgi:hypothetical protein
MYVILLNIVLQYYILSKSNQRKVQYLNIALQYYTLSKNNQSKDQYLAC